ncbi:MAG: murein biosynthesis integral membrane protein MurJ [Deltaproteobacteria bacterium]
MQNAASDTGKIARSAGTVGIAVMCSRVLGLVREQVFAALFGAGFAYDAFVVAFRIPNLLRDLFGEGALSAAFVTVFSDYDENRGEVATWQLANNVFCVIAILLSLISLGGIYFSENLVRLLAPDYGLIAGKVALTTKLTAIMFPFLIFVSLSAVIMGILNAKGRFFVPSMASSFFNLGSIAGGVALALTLPRFGQPAIVGMAIGTLLGGILQLGWQLPSLFRVGFRLQLLFRLRDPGLLRIFRLMIPAIVGLSATQLNIFINTFFASSCVQGSVSWLNYAFRLVQFPIGVFGVAVSIATLPVISRYAAVKNIQAIRETYASAMLMGFCLTLPASVGLIVLAEPIIRLIFQHGAFSAFATAKTAEALLFYSIGLFAYSAVKIMVPVFYALDNTRYPVIASFLAVITNVVIILLSLHSLQHRAIALATSCSMIGSFSFLSVVLYRKLEGYSISHLGRGTLKIGLACAVMGIYLVWLKKTVLPAGGSFGLLHLGLWLLFCIGSSAVLYGVTLHFLGLDEFTDVSRKIRERLRG